MVNLIDTILVNKAKKTNEIIKEIDSSWRNLLEKEKERAVILPFEKDNYNCIIRNGHFLVEGYNGELSIEKIQFNKYKIYKIKEPLKYYPYKIYGIFDKKGNWIGLTTEPLLGFHYYGLTSAGKTLCTGELEITPPKTKTELEEICQNVIRMFKIVNLMSLGDIHLPPDIPEKFKIYSSLKDYGIELFKEKQLLEEINILGEE